MHFVYILYSPSLNRYYVGETAEVEKRLMQHIEGYFMGSYTKQAKDWNLKTTITFSNISTAKKAENFIKRMNSKIFIEKLILDSNWLVEKFDT